VTPASFTHGASLRLKMTVILTRRPLKCELDTHL